jgi:hypothetical protein
VYKAAGNDMYTLYRSNSYTVASVKTGDSLFNLRFSPKNTLFRNRNLIAGCSYPFSLPLAIYSSSERETGLVELIAGVPQSERGNMQMHSAIERTPLFLPFLFTFYTSYDVQLISRIKNNRYGYVEFEWEGIAMKGFIYDEVNVFPSVKKEIEWRLIAHPDVDIKAILTRYNETGKLISTWY